MRKNNNRSRQRVGSDEAGAALIEYAISISLLLGVFLLGAQLLQVAAEERADRSIEVAADNTLPCNSGSGGLIGDECL